MMKRVIDYKSIVSLTYIKFVYVVGLLVFLAERARRWRVGGVWCVGRLRGVWGVRGVRRGRVVGIKRP